MRRGEEEEEVLKAGLFSLLGIFGVGLVEALDEGLNQIQRRRKCSISQKHIIDVYFIS